MKDILGITAMILAFLAYAPYFRDIFRKKTVPHPYSWLIWGLSSALVFGLSFSHGGGAGSWTLIATTLICLTIAALALKNGGARYITRKDVALFAAALIALALWIFTNQPVLAILLLVGADMLGIVPSLFKAWKMPYTETLSLWVISTFRHGISIAALTSYNLVTLLDPVVWLVANGSFAVVLIYRRHALRDETDKKSELVSGA